MFSKIERLRVTILLMTAVCFTWQSWGVLSEYKLEQTLISLSADMEALQQNVRKDILRSENRQNVIRRIRFKKDKLSQLETDLSIITNRYNELSYFLKGLETKLSTPKSREALLKSVVIADSLKLSVDSCISSVTEDKTKYRNLLCKTDRLEIYNICHEIMPRQQICGLRMPTTHPSRAYNNFVSL